MTETNKWGKLDEQLNAPQDEIILIIDRSGSMQNIWADTLGGINSFLDKNKEVGPALVTIVAFDDIIEYPRGEGKQDLLNMKNISSSEFRPRGSTAMNDAIGITLNGFTPNHPDAKVAVVIATDGGENASKEYTDRGVVKKMVEEKEALGWNFTFLAADLDALGEARSFGMTGSTMKFDKSGEGIRSAYMFASADTVCYRTGSTMVQNETNEEELPIGGGQPQIQQDVDWDDIRKQIEQAQLDSHNQ